MYVNFSLPLNILQIFDNIPKTVWAQVSFHERIQKFLFWWTFSIQQKVECCLSLLLPEDFIGVAWDWGLLFWSSMAFRFKQSVRSTVHHHAGSCHGDNCHTVPNAGFQAVVPLIIGYGKQTCVNSARRRGRIQSDMERTKRLRTVRQKLSLRGKKINKAKK